MHARHPTEHDFIAVLALVAAGDRAVYGATDWTEDGLREEWDELDLGRDAWVVEVDGRIAGYATFEDRRHGRLSIDGYVHPDLRGRGVGARLLELGEARAREVEPTVPAGERVWLESAHLVGDERAPALFACKRYRRVRSFFRMVVTHDAPPEPATWPAGVEIGPLDLERDGRAAHAAIEEAFSHEWGFRPAPYEEWLETRVWKGSTPRCRSSCATGATWQRSRSTPASTGATGAGSAISA